MRYLELESGNGAASEIRTRTICLEGRYTSHYTNAAYLKEIILH